MTSATLPGMAKRPYFKTGGYSREYSPHGDTGKRYLLDKIPAGLWTKAREKARRETRSMRTVILSLLEQWVKS